MKTFNIKSWVKSPRVQKWGLFGLLAATLGFNLSMNPEHFNNIARHEKPEAFQTMEMASDNAPDIKIDATAAKPYELEKGNKRFKITPYSVNVDGQPTTTQAIVEELCDCADKKITTYTLSAAIGETLKWKEELSKKMSGGETATSSDSKTAEKKKKITLDAADFDLAKIKEIGQKCKDEPKDRRVNCHVKKIIAMSKALDDSSDAKKAVNNYFDHFLLSTLNELYSAPTVDLMSFGENFTHIAEAEEIAEQLIEDLNPGNYAGVRERLEALKKGFYSSQLRNTQKMFIFAKREQESPNLYTRLHGQKMEEIARRNFDVEALSYQLNGDMQRWAGYMKNGDKEADISRFQSNFFYPVQGLIDDLARVDLNGVRTGTGTVAANQAAAAQRLSQLVIPDLSGLNTISPYSGGNYYPNTAGLPGNITSRSGVNPLFDAWQSRLRGASNIGCNYSSIQPTQYSQRLQECGNPQGSYVSQGNYINRVSRGQ